MTNDKLLLCFITSKWYFSNNLTIFFLCSKTLTNVTPLNEVYKGSNVILCSTNQTVWRWSNGTRSHAQISWQHLPSPKCPYRLCVRVASWDEWGTVASWTCGDRSLGVAGRRMTFHWWRWWRASPAHVEGRGRPWKTENETLQKVGGGKQRCPLSSWPLNRSWLSGGYPAVWLVHIWWNSPCRIQLPPVGALYTRRSWCSLAEDLEVIGRSGSLIGQGDPWWRRSQDPMPQSIPGGTDLGLWRCTRWLQFRCRKLRHLAPPRDNMFSHVYILKLVVDRFPKFLKRLIGPFAE